MPAPDSRFVYPRSITRDVAATLNDLQGLVPDQVTLRIVRNELANTFAEHDPLFDADDFINRATLGRR